MFIVSLKGSDLFVQPTLADVIRYVGQKYAETDLRAVFDGLAVPYRVHWLRPNRHRKILFGLFDSIELGEFDLVPAGPAEPSALIKLIEAYSGHIRPRAAEQDLASLVAKLRAV